MIVQVKVTWRMKVLDHLQACYIQLKSKQSHRAFSERMLDCSGGGKWIQA